jgi:hypothetical protein
VSNDPFSGSVATRKDIGDILLRLFYLRHRLRGKLPEQLLNVKANIQEHNLREKIEQVNDRDVFLPLALSFPANPSRSRWAT